MAHVRACGWPREVQVASFGQVSRTDLRIRPSSLLHNVHTSTITSFPSSCFCHYHCNCDNQNLPELQNVANPMIRRNLRKTTSSYFLTLQTQMLSTARLSSRSLSLRLRDVVFRVDKCLAVYTPVAIKRREQSVKKELLRFTPLGVVKCHPVLGFADQLWDVYGFVCGKLCSCIWVIAVSSSASVALYAYYIVDDQKKITAGCTLLRHHASSVFFVPTRKKE
ncbi:hypothetical protein GBA52_025477 [Prunus armeniaca]|nr:hypothetical protein GBA52_025477 [Prunus armeniaca]